MKQLTGIANNINKVIIGKITTENNYFGNKKDLIYVTNKTKFPKGYLAVITSLNHIYTNKQIVVGDVDITKLHDNDIVTIDPEGKISIIYEINSNHNVIFITERCNSNCIMCPQPPINHEDNYFDENIKLISLIDKEEKYIGITGGEPTLIGDKLFNILSAIHKRIPKATINLLSNGIKFENYEYAKRFAKSIKQDIIVDIPLYSDIDNIHNSIVRTNSFYKTIKGIYNLAKFNIKVGIRIVVHRLNYDRLPELSEFIYTNFPFVNHVAFMQMEPIGYAKDHIDKLWIDPSEYNIELEKSVLNLHYRALNVSIYNTQLCILPEILRRFAVQSISDWKNIYIKECEDCTKKIECPGFFASSRTMHSSRIKPFKEKTKSLKLNLEIEEENYLSNMSKKLIDIFDCFESIKNDVIVDVPCGYGRNMYLFAKNNYSVIGIDSDTKALEYINKMKVKYGYIEENVKMVNSNILNEWHFSESTLGGIINVHFYRKNLVVNFTHSLKSGGYLYIETPNLNGNNHLELPEKNELKQYLENEFDILYYVERSAKLTNKVSVTLFAKKR